MALPIAFLARFAVPLIVAGFYLDGFIPEQAQTYTTSLETSDKVLSFASKDGEGPTESYDYIIIGAGSAGAVLAKRLTENRTVTVLVLEAGGDPNPVSEVPLFQPELASPSSGMWFPYETTSQQYGACQNHPEKRCDFPRGKALGGSSSVNGLVYNRCNSKDYDSWANFTGDPIWLFSNVVGAFMSVENYHGHYEDDAGLNHGTDGEIHIGRIDYTPGYEIFQQAVLEQGHAVGDLNNGLLSSGWSRLDHTIKDGLRWSSYHGFLEPILGRENLKIYRYASATKIHLDAAKNAIGVTYKRHGETRYVTAKQEILLSAGAVDSPKLLMLSGIGPADHLAQHGIPVLLDLPAVGSNLQEHLGLEIHPFSINRTLGLINSLTPENIALFVNNASGPLAQAPYAVHIANGYFPSKTWNDSTWPDLHAYINEKLVAPEGQPIEQQISVEIELVRSWQTGTIRLASSNPETHPIIDPRFFEDPLDLQRMVEGVEYCENLFLTSPTFQALGIRWSPTIVKIPACAQFTFPSSEYWACFIKANAGCAFHPTSTCRMGPNNSTSVVDSRLRVFGAQGLRVIDSSVMPYAPNGNTHMPSVMIGEMGARIILNQI